LNFALELHAERFDQAGAKTPPDRGLNKFNVPPADLSRRRGHRAAACCEFSGAIPEHAGRHRKSGLTLITPLVDISFGHSSTS
jgi:hypothetical protein